MEKKKLEVVAAAIKRTNADGRTEFFCAKRGAPKPGKPATESNYRWEFPGGKIEEGETCEMALEREIYEEFGTHVKVQDKFCTVEYEYMDFYLFLHVYICRLEQGELTLTEHIDSCWLLPEELPQIDWAPADYVVALRLCSERL